MKRLLSYTCLLLLGTTALNTSAAIVLDRTRTIYPGGAKSISFNIKNENQKLPYLAQAWVEDAQGKKISSPFVVLPPIQRVDANEKAIVRVASVPAIDDLPKDRESVYYFNLREIPPKSEKTNVMQIAVQSKIKLFYRPDNILPDKGAIWQDQVTISKQGTTLKFNNPTPYFITYVGLANLNSKEKQPIKGFSAFMVSPKSEMNTIISEVLSAQFVISYVNDYGGLVDISYQCLGNVCRSIKSE